MENKIILESLAMDLKRAAIGYHRKSYAMADRFLAEAIKRKNEFKKENTRPYLLQILENIEKLKTQPGDELAENALMYSTLIQNYVLTSILP